MRACRSSVHIMVLPYSYMKVVAPLAPADNGSTNANTVGTTDTTPALSL